MPGCMMVRDQGGAPELRSERIQVLFEEGLFGMRNSVSERLSDLPKVTQLENAGKVRKPHFDLLSNTRTVSCCGWCVFRKSRHVGIQGGGGVMGGRWLQT